MSYTVISAKVCAEGVDLKEEQGKKGWGRAARSRAGQGIMTQQGSQEQSRAGQGWARQGRAGLDRTGQN